VVVDLAWATATTTAPQKTIDKTTDHATFLITTLPC
jgi:hypothetical protein